MVTDYKKKYIKQVNLNDLVSSKLLRDLWSVLVLYLDANLDWQPAERCGTIAANQYNHIKATARLIELVQIEIQRPNQVTEKP